MLRCVLEALRTPLDRVFDRSGGADKLACGATALLRSKMLIFGMAALETFKARLVEWPQYCHHILQMSHIRYIRESHPELVQHIESCCLYSSSGDAPLPLWMETSLNHASASKDRPAGVQLQQSAQMAGVSVYRVSSQTQGFGQGRAADSAAQAQSNSHRALPGPPLTALRGDVRDSRNCGGATAGSHFTCFASAKAQILTLWCVLEAWVCRCRASAKMPSTSVQVCRTLPGTHVPETPQHKKEREREMGKSSAEAQHL